MTGDDDLKRRVGRLEPMLDDETPIRDHRTDESESEGTRSVERRRGDPGRTSPAPRDRGDPAASPTADPDDDREAGDDGRNRERDVGITWLGRVGSVALVLGIVFFVRVAIEAGVLGPLGRVAAGSVGGLALLAGIYIGTSRTSVSRDGMAGTTVVVLSGASAVVALGTFAATVGLLAVTCGAVAVARYGPGDAPRTGAHLVAVGTVGKLLAVDARELAGFSLADPLATATGRPAAFLLVIVVYYGLASWFRRDTVEMPRRGGGVAVATPYLLTATAVAVVGLGVELSGFGLSVAWATFAATLFGIGLRADARSFRLQGVAVFGVTTARCFCSHAGARRGCPDDLVSGPREPPAGGVVRVRPLARLPSAR
jgi:uncharacterized membrane protein